MSHRVVQEDPDQLTDRVFVARDSDAGPAAHQLAFGVNPLSLSADLAHDQGQLDGGEVQLEPGVCPGEGQHAIDQARHARGFGRDVRRRRATHLIGDGRP